MAALEELLYSMLIQDTTLTGMLAVFSGQPALFEYRAPPDTDTGWNGGKQYPRVDYSVQRREDPERRVSGEIFINIWHETDAGTVIEDLEARLRTILDGAVFHPTDEPVIGMRWATSEFFTAGRSQFGLSMSELVPTDLVYGMSMTLQLLAFPVQTTFSPDPVDALNTWATSAFGTDLQVDLSAWTPTAGAPALYWRFDSMQVARIDQAVTWYDATVYGHLVAPMPQDRLTWTRKVVEDALNARTFAFASGSWMLVQKLSADTKQDPLRVGQIKMVVRYGVQVPQSSATVLQNAYLNGSKEGSANSG